MIGREMTKPEIVGEGFELLFKNDSSSGLLIERADPEQEEKGFLVYRFFVHSYEDIEEDVRDTIDFKEKWKNAVENGDTDDGYRDWLDIHESEEIEDEARYYESDYQNIPEAWDWFRNSWTGKSVYYEAQIEQEKVYSIRTIKDFNDMVEEEGILEEIKDGELYLEIIMYLDNSVFRYIP